MPTERLDACEVVRRSGGCATWDQILRYSTSHSVRRALASGQLRRIAKGTYALPDLPLADQAAAAARGLVSHTSAAQHWLLEGLTQPTAAHVTVPRNARPRPVRGVTLHYSEVDPRDDHGGVTSPLRTVLDCALILPFADALSIADSALRRDLVTPEQLIAAAQARSRAGRQRVMRIARAADGRAANPFESGLRASVIEAGLSGFEPQHVVRLPSFEARVDLGDPELRTAIEADSFAYHGTRDALVQDCHRYNELVRGGWQVLRFSWEHVMFDRSWLRSIVVDACALRSGDRNPARRGRHNDGAAVQDQ
jgi:very-short-patch-repair endonuclease